MTQIIIARCLNTCVVWNKVITRFFTDLHVISGLQGFKKYKNIFRAPSDKPLLQVAEEIKYTTKAVELLITHQLENIRTKFKSISELETHEAKITRRLSSHRQSQRERARQYRRNNRLSRIRDDHLEEPKVF